MLRMTTTNMNSVIKQQPCSPVNYNTYSRNYYNPHQHRQSTTSTDNEQLSPLSNNTAETSSVAALVPPSATDGGGGWYE